METHLPKWALELFTSADAVTQSAVLIALLAATGAVLYGYPSGEPRGCLGQGSHGCCGALRG